MHKNHILNESGCLNIHLNISVVQGERARTASILLTQEIQNPWSWRHIYQSQNKSKNFNCVTKSEPLGSSGSMKVQSHS